MVDLSTDADDIADFLECLSELETTNSQLFKTLSEKIILSSVKPQLSKIADYNDKHAKYLSALSQGIGNPKVKTKECKKKLGVVCENTENILKQAKGKEEITLEELLDYLQILESTGGAAQYLLAQAETFLTLSNEITKLYGMASQQFNELLNEIIQDIEENINLLENIKNIIQNEQNKNKKKNPLFKYQTPDAWFTPSRSQQHEI
jgi:hypothetical protein